MNERGMADTTAHQMAQQAVFLSYARQDAESARRIADALRACGVEVWFDQSDLRGGDSWDQKIRRQIKACALFMPVVSAHTQERGEGYFRLEWRLAVERTYLMVAGSSFLVPVVVDDTPEAPGMVPDEFLSVQWTRLAQGVPTPQFVDHVKGLVGAPRRVAAQAAQLAVAAPVRRFGWPFWVGGAFVGALIAGAAYLLLRPSTGVTSPARQSSVESATLVPTATDNSIAVLPFVDMSQARDQEYFSDGLTEELLNLLAKTSKLRVIGRTSSFQFKGRNDDLRLIGQKLGVAHLLEGSVRKAGNKIRITVQLIEAANGSHQWSETYDRDLNDIFKVQDEIAAAVVAQLKAKLLNGAAPGPRAMPNTEAYTLVLKGRYWLARISRDDLAKAIDYFQQAIQMEPDYAQAWVGLSNCYEDQAKFGAEVVEVAMPKAREAAQKAIALDPKLAEAHAAFGSIQLLYDWDFAGANASMQHALALDPINVDALLGAALFAYVSGRPDEAIALYGRAIARDPLRAGAHRSLAVCLFWAGRLTEAEAAVRRAIFIEPNLASAHYALGVMLLARGQPQAALEAIQAEVDPDWRRIGLPLAYHALGRNAESDAALHDLIEKEGQTAAFQIAEAYAYRGEIDQAFAWLDRGYAQRDSGILALKIDPLLRSLGGDPRFDTLLKKIGLGD
jgi:TolB-like protein/Tfp pilus assembly protein PilF